MSTEFVGLLFLPFICGGSLAGVFFSSVIPPPSSVSLLPAHSRSGPSSDTVFKYPPLSFSCPASSETVIMDTCIFLVISCKSHHLKKNLIFFNTCYFSFLVFSCMLPPVNATKWLILLLDRVTVGTVYGIFSCVLSYRISLWIPSDSFCLFS